MNYMNLTNDVNAALNEVELTPATFSNAIGYYRDAKRAVNAALRKINQEGVRWPFNHFTSTVTLTIDQARYTQPVTTKEIFWDSFRILGTDTYSTTWLSPLDYEDYLRYYSDMEYNPSRYHSIPSHVVRTPDMGYIIVSPPDKAYELKFEYAATPPDLSDWDDEPTIPEVMRHVIFAGSMYYAYMFRGDLDAASLYRRDFEDGVKQMRGVYIERIEYVSATNRGGRRRG